MQTSETDSLPTMGVIEGCEAEVGTPMAFPMLVSRNTRMRRVIDRLRPLAEDGGPVLFQGEPGVGKRLLANVMHAWSRQPLGLQYLFSCADDPPDQLRKLIGQGKAGRTLILDEIGRLAMSEQDIVAEILDRRHPLAAEGETQRNILRSLPHRARIYT